MRMTNGKEVHVRMENDTTKSMILKAMIGLIVWITLLYLLASKL